MLPTRLELLQEEILKLAHVFAPHDHANAFEVVPPTPHHGPDAEVLDHRRFRVRLVQSAKAFALSPPVTTWYDGDTLEHALEDLRSVYIGMLYIQTHSLAEATKQDPRAQAPRAEPLAPAIAVPPPPDPRVDECAALLERSVALVSGDYAKLSRSKQSTRRKQASRLRAKAGRLRDAMQQDPSQVGTHRLAKVGSSEEITRKVDAVLGPHVDAKDLEAKVGDLLESLQNQDWITGKVDLYPDLKLPFEKVEGKITDAKKTLAGAPKRKPEAAFKLDPRARKA